MKKQELIDFESEVVELFNDGKLKSPVHLSGGNEEEVISLFKNIKPTDWVFSTYRGHYHALLHGIDKDWLKQWILNNKSIHVMNKEHKFWTSAIVGGCLSIALGTAMAIKLKGEYSDVKEGDKLPIQASIPHVWVFCGDMTAETGQFHEVTKYARRHDLPITFIVEDNGLSTDTPTQKTWGEQDGGPNILRYTYKRTYPHYGTGKFVSKLWENVDETKSKGF